MELKGRNGEYIPSFISIDKLTNEVVAMKAENAFIPREIKGVELTEQEQNDLREGKEGLCRGHDRQVRQRVQRLHSGKMPNAGVSSSFSRTTSSSTARHSGGVELTQKQIEDLNAGKAIFVEGMQRKDGEVFSSYVKLDEATGRPSYTRYNPDSRRAHVKSISPTKSTG